MSLYHNTKDFSSRDILIECSIGKLKKSKRILLINDDGVQILIPNENQTEHFLSFPEIKKFVYSEKNRSVVFRLGSKDIEIFVKSPMEVKMEIDERLRELLVKAKVDDPEETLESLTESDLSTGSGSSTTSKRAASARHIEKANFSPIHEEIKLSLKGEPLNLLKSLGEVHGNETWWLVTYKHREVILSVSPKNIRILDSFGREEKRFPIAKIPHFIHSPDAFGFECNPVAETFMFQTKCVPYIRAKLMEITGSPEKVTATNSSSDIMHRSKSHGDVPSITHHGNPFEHTLPRSSTQRKNQPTKF